MKRVLLWLRIIRPQTLFASLVPVLVGLWTVHRGGGAVVDALAVRGGSGAVVDSVAAYRGSSAVVDVAAAGGNYAVVVDVAAAGGNYAAVVNAHPVLTAILTAFCALSLQVLSNLINDYYDFLRGSDKAGRAGFKRALAEGEVTKQQMLAAILITLGLCVASGLYLVMAGGWVILLIGLTAILFAWLYTATGKSLSYLGIADIFVFLYYGVIASAGTAYLLTRTFSPTAFHAGAVCGLISMCVLMINNLRDIESDRAAGKRTLPVRFGKKAAEGIMLAEVLLMPLFAFLAFGWSPAMLIVVAALALYAATLRAEGAAYNRCLLCTGLVNVLYLILCLL